MNSRPPGRWRYGRWLAAIIIGAAVLASGGMWLEACLVGKAWTDACAEADRLDPGWRWEDLIAARPNPPDDRNIALRVRAIRQAMPQKWPDWAVLLTDDDVPLPPAQKPGTGDAGPPGPDAPVVPPPEVRREVFGSDLEREIPELLPTTRLRPDQISALRKAFVAAQNGLDKTRGLETLKPGRNIPERERPLLNHLLPTWIQEPRAVTGMLRLHSVMLAHDGQMDAALEDCRRMLALERAASAEPMLINALVAMATRSVASRQVERVLGQGEPSPQALDQTRRAFEAAISEPLMLEALRGERAFVEDCVRSVDEGLFTADKMGDDPPPTKVTGIEPIDRFLQKMRGGLWTKRHSAGVLRFYTMLIEFGKESPDGIRTHSADIAAFRAEMDPRVQQATSTCDQMLFADRRNRALLASAAAALAAERFRHERGRWPESLADLVTAKMLSAVPADPFDGQPLRMRRLSDGLVIYSVGQDLTDDGGEVRVDPNVGGQPKDVGVRLWDVSRRGK